VTDSKEINQFLPKFPSFSIKLQSFYNWINQTLADFSLSQVKLMIFLCLDKTLIMLLKDSLSTKCFTFYQGKPKHFQLINTEFKSCFWQKQSGFLTNFSCFHQNCSNFQQNWNDFHDGLMDWSYSSGYQRILKNSPNNFSSFRFFQLNLCCFWLNFSSFSTDLKLFFY
jgi:hypothetical protein